MKLGGGKRGFNASDEGRGGRVGQYFDEGRGGGEGEGLCFSALVSSAKLRYSFSLLLPPHREFQAC